jgi:hypothetical protein
VCPFSVRSYRKANPASFVYFEPPGESWLWYRKNSWAAIVPNSGAGKAASCSCISRLPARRTRPTRAPRQRKVRVERMLLLRDAKSRQRLIHSGRQRSQSSTRFNSDPENSRRPHAREKSIPTKVHFEAIRRNRFQSKLDSFSFILRLLSDEFQRNVQRFGPHPTRLRSKFAHALEKDGNAPSNSIVDIEGNEKAHRKLLALGLNRSVNTISRSSLPARSRNCSRDAKDFKLKAKS